MFLKIIGAGIVIAASNSIGFKIAKSLEERLYDIRAFKIAINILEKEMVYLSSNVADALASASESSGRSKNIFKKCAAILEEKNGVCIKDAWTMAIEKHISETNLLREDQKIIESLGSILGQYDLDSQSKSIKLVSMQLDTQEKKAEEAISKNSKMYRQLGILAGAAIAILLL